MKNQQSYLDARYGRTGSWDAGTHNILATGADKDLLSSALMGWIACTVARGVSFVLAANSELCLVAGKLAQSRGYVVAAASRNDMISELLELAAFRPVAILILAGDYESDFRISNRILSAMLSHILTSGKDIQLEVFIDELPLFGSIEHIGPAMDLSLRSGLRFVMTAKRSSDVAAVYQTTGQKILDACLSTSDGQREEQRKNG